jgi:hypothetical protein
MNALARFLSWFKVEEKPTAVHQPDPRYDGPAFQTDGVTSMYFHEDDYCQVQLLPKEDQVHLSAEGAKVKVVAEKNFTGYGFANIHVPAKEPIPLSSRSIGVSEIDSILIADRFIRIETVFSGSMSDRALAQNTVAYRLGGYSFYYDHENGTVQREIHTPTYDLLLPAEQKALLILFPCFPCDAADTRAESRIADTAAANGIAVLMLNFNQHILMSEAEQQEVIGTIAGAVKEHGVDASNTFIGGFSSGGNVSVLLAKALLRSAEPPVKLKGVFAVDSPLDLVLLYECAQARPDEDQLPRTQG